MLGIGACVRVWCCRRACITYCRNSSLTIEPIISSWGTLSKYQASPAHQHIEYMYALIHTYLYMYIIICVYSPMSDDHCIFCIPERCCQSLVNVCTPCHTSMSVASRQVVRPALLALALLCHAVLCDALLIYTTISCWYLEIE